MENRPKTKSKSFYDDEIIDVYNNIVYLKMGVYRKYPPTISEWSLQNINYHEKFAAKMQEVKDIVAGEKDFS